MEKLYRKKGKRIMTLKEKFKEILTAFWINDWEDKCETIADEFAINFADWLIKRQTNYFESLKELLEIYKKEKGL
jgi:hypothetical protein